MYSFFTRHLSMEYTIIKNTSVANKHIIRMFDALTIFDFFVECLEKQIIYLVISSLLFLKLFFRVFDPPICRSKIKVLKIYAELPQIIIYD